MLGHRTLDVHDYLSILKRRGWIIAVPVILLPILAFFSTFLIVPQYLSQTLVIIDQQKVPDDYVKPVISSDLDSRLASMKEQMLSRSSIQPIIERFNLGGSRMSMDDRIELVRKNINIKPIHSEIAHTGGLPGFFISFTASDPHTAQLVCGEITSLFTSANLKSREAAAEGTTEFLKSQLADAKRTLDEQDSKLAAFERQYVGRLPGEETPNVNMLTSLNTQLEAATQALSRLQQDKSYEEAMLAQQIQSAPSQTLSPSGMPLPSQGVGLATQQAELQTLLAQESELTSHYTADYPDVIAVRRKIADVRRQIAAAPPPAAVNAPAGSNPSRYDSPGIQQMRAQIRSVDMGIQSKRAEQAQIQSDVHIYQDRIQSSPLVEEQYKELTRDHLTAENFYNDLLGKMNQSKMATDLETRMQGEQFRVMDEPNLPDAPNYPKRGLFTGAGLFAGLMLGLLIVAFLEYRNTALRTERDITIFTKLPTLAIIAFSAEIQVATADKPTRLQRLMHFQKAVPPSVQG